MTDDQLHESALESGSPGDSPALARPLDQPIINAHPSGEKSVVIKDSDTSIEGQFEPLSPSQITLERRIGYVVALIVSVVVISSTLPLFWFALEGVWIAALLPVGWLALISLLIWWSHFWPAIAYRHARWRLSENGMEIRRGVFWQHRIAVPVARVQHVDVSQGPVQRLFELGKLTINTAGTKNASIELDGLQYNLAMQIRDQLIEQKESLDVI